MGFFLIGLAIFVGWMSWSWWLCVPLGLINYIDLYRKFPERATRIASSIWLSAPLYYLLFIWIGSVIERWISN